MGQENDTDLFNETSRLSITAKINAIARAYIEAQPPVKIYWRSCTGQFYQGCSERVFYNVAWMSTVDS